MINRSVSHLFCVDEWYMDEINSSLKWGKLACQYEVNGRSVWGHFEVCWLMCDVVSGWDCHLDFLKRLAYSSMVNMQLVHSLNVVIMQSLWFSVESVWGHSYITAWSPQGHCDSPNNVDFKEGKIVPVSTRSSCCATKAFCSIKYGNSTMKWRLRKRLVYIYIHGCTIKPEAHEGCILDAL